MNATRTLATKGTRRQAVASAPPTFDYELLAEGTMTVVAASKFLGLSRDTVDRRIDKGTIPWTHLEDDAKKLVPVRALKLLLARNMINGDAVTSDA